MDLNYRAKLTTVKNYEEEINISTIHLVIIHFSATQRFYLRYE